jgi:hypothetical protein
MADSDPVTKKDLQELESRLEPRFDAKLEAFADRLTELVRDVETTMLTAFHGYAKGQAVRLQAVEIADAAVNQRLDALEQRVLNLETRRPH